MRENVHSIVTSILCILWQRYITLLEQYISHLCRPKCEWLQFFFAHRFNIRYVDPYKYPILWLEYLQIVVKPLSASSYALESLDMENTASLHELYYNNEWTNNIIFLSCGVFWLKYLPIVPKPLSIYQASQQRSYNSSPHVTENSANFHELWPLDQNNTPTHLNTQIHALPIKATISV